MSELMEDRLRRDDDFREAVCAWLRANDIDPADVPAEAVAIVFDGEIAIPCTVRTPDGGYLRSPADRNQTVIRMVTVPLKVPPTPLVKEWLTPRCPTCGR